jgi:tetrapyrrole methylase family protein / MazG family protein
MPQRYPAIPVNEFRKFVSIVRRLRKDCPWDRQQTHRSLRESLLEETYEVLESLDNDDIQELRNELGDLMLHVVLHGTIAEQSGEFTLAEVLDSISKKLVRRHPHVFGTTRVSDAEEVTRNWETLKLEEGRSSLLQGVPRRMPSLQRAYRIQQRAAKVGFDWKKAEDVWEKIREELGELRKALRKKNAKEQEEEFGDLLFALVNYARFLRLNPENALRGTTEKFISRFRYIEKELAHRGKDVHGSSLEEMDALWNEAKRKRLRKRK